MKFILIAKKNCILTIIKFWSTQFYYWEKSKIRVNEQRKENSKWRDLHNNRQNRNYSIHINDIVKTGNRNEEGFIEEVSKSAWIWHWSWGLLWGKSYANSWRIQSCFMIPVAGINMQKFLLPWRMKVFVSSTFSAWPGERHFSRIALHCLSFQLIFLFREEEK